MTSKMILVRENIMLSRRERMKKMTLMTPVPTENADRSMLGDLKRLFPTKGSFVVFISYMGLFINQGSQYINSIKKVQQNFIR